MKHWLTLALLAVLTIFSMDTYAQHHGIRAGWQRATMADGSEPVGDPLNGFYGGFFTAHDIGTSILQWSTGLEYMQGGWKNDDDNFRKIHYLSAQVSLRVKLGPVFAQAGVNVNAKLAETYEVNGEDALNDDTETKGLDVPAHIGLGLQLGPVLIEARYHYGLYDANDGTRNAYLQAGAGFTF